MILRPLCSYLVAFVLMMASPLSSHASKNHADECLLHDSWRTVDSYQLSAQNSANAEAISHSESAIFVAGSANASPIQTHWIVRRSLDRGQTWRTVDQVAGQFNKALGVAYDPGSRSIYAVGFTDRAAGFFGWTVRKSANNGQSWATVDTFPESAGEYSIAHGVSAGPNGIIYVTGVRGVGPGSVLTTRRSDDGGATWRTVDSYSTAEGTHANSVLAAKNGGVFVGGFERLAPGQQGSWIVRFSRNGRTNWTTVDRLPNNNNTSLVLGGTISDTLKGRQQVVFVGSYLDENNVAHWITRRAFANRPTAWSMIDDYADATGGAEALAATFSRGPQIFVAGAQYSRQITEPTYITRRADTTDDVFGTTDLVSGETVPNTAISTSAFGAGRSFEGDILTAGSYVDPSTRQSSVWLVRMLPCR
ncbi:MAG: sialidase family protein [Bdellovibrionota bacterium]